jgi:hypothetical protein
VAVAWGSFAYLLIKDSAPTRPTVKSVVSNELYRGTKEQEKKVLQRKGN